MHSAILTVSFLQVDCKAIFKDRSLLKQKEAHDLLHSMLKLKPRLPIILDSKKKIKNDKILDLFTTGFDYDPVLDYIL